MFCADADPHRHTQRLVRQINSLSPYGNLYGGFSVCKGGYENMTPPQGTPKRGVPLPPGPVWACPVPAGPVGRWPCEPFHCFQILPSWDFMASVSVCFPVVSWSISRCHAFGRSPRRCLSVLSDTWLLVRSYRISSRPWRCSNCSRFSGFLLLASCLWMDLVLVVLFPHLPVFGKNGDPALSLDASFPARHSNSCSYQRFFS